MSFMQNLLSVYFFRSVPCMSHAVVLAWACLLCFAGGAQPWDAREWLKFSAKQLKGTAQELRGKPVYPHYTEKKPGAERYTWSTVIPDQWTSGFFPGLLWQMYNWTRDEDWRQKADHWTRPLRYESKHHDLGMKMYYSFGLAYELTGEDYYLQALKDACGHLSKKFQKVVGSINAWGRNLIIIDTMINIQLFAYTYLKVRKEEKAQFRMYYDMAISHADKSLKELIKPDGSTYHVFEYNPGSGAVGRRDNTPQGYGLSKSKTSVWSRGQAWAMYAYPAMYRFTGHSRYVEAAVLVSDWFLAHLPPKHVPWWDFGVPDNLKKYDTSAASCAAAGLLELAQYVPEPKAEHYRRSAKAILKSLTEHFAVDPAESHAILREAVSVFPAQHSIVYGDYYFVEALLRLIAAEDKGPQESAAAVPNATRAAAPPEQTPQGALELPAEQPRNVQVAAVAQDVPPVASEVERGGAQVSERNSDAAASDAEGDIPYPTLEPEDRIVLSPWRVFWYLFSMVLVVCCLSKCRVKI